MKKILLVLVSFLLLLFVLERVWDFLILENQNIKLSYVSKGGKSYDVLVHGPCEPLFTIDPSYLDSLTGLRSYNYALKHTDFADNYLHLHLFLKRNPAPQKMLLYVTPESFDLNFNTFHTFRFAAHLNDTIVASTVEEMDPDYYRYTWIPFAKYAYYNSYKTFDAIQGFKHWLSDEKSPYFASGHVPHENTNYTEEDDGFVAPKELLYANGKKVDTLANGSVYYEIYDSAQVFQWESLREKYLRKTIELAQAHHIEVILYESTPYWGSIVNQGSRLTFLNKTNEIAREYQVPYWIYDDLAIGKEKANFVCPLILGEDAGKQFMRKLAKDLQEH